MNHKKSINKIFSCTVVLSFCCLLFTISLQAQNTVIKAGYLFDSRTGKILHNQTIIIKDGKILEVGGNLKYSGTDTIIDLSKSWVLPGLMDCHVHITDNSLYRKRSRGMPVTNFTESSGFRALRGGYVGEQFLRSGFTAIKEIGNYTNNITADVIKAIREGCVKGPTIFYQKTITVYFCKQLSLISNFQNGESDRFAIFWGIYFTTG